MISDEKKQVEEKHACTNTITAERTGADQFGLEGVYTIYVLARSSNAQRGLSLLAHARQKGGNWQRGGVSDEMDFTCRLLGSTYSHELNITPRHEHCATTETANLMKRLN